MPTAYQTTTSQADVRSSPYRSLETLTAPFAGIACRSTSLIAGQPGRFELASQSHDLPRYLLLGPAGGAEPLRIGIFAGVHGDEPASSFALLRFVRLLEENPQIARGYCLFLYPVCNPTGFEDNTRQSRRGKDLNREFWSKSSEPEVGLLQAELVSHSFHGIISLHVDDTSDGFYGIVNGATLARNLIEPALKAADAFLPLDKRGLIDGFPARNSVVRDSFPGVLSAPPVVRPRPFEIILEAPKGRPAFLTEYAFAAALQSILAGYRKFIAYAQNL